MPVEINNECVANLLNAMGIRILKYINILTLWCSAIPKVDVAMETHIATSKATCPTSKPD